MAAAIRALLVAALTTAALFGTALGASYTVGAPAGSWDLRTNYTQWTSSIRFYTGDELRFQYPAATHNVVEVTKTAYDNCSSSSPIATFPSGNDVIPLAAVGTRYFICGLPGHCAGGMKIQVNVESKVVRCRGRGARQRCRQTTPPASSAPQAGSEPVLALGLGAVVAGLMLFF
ncbi:uclacyanin 1-like [Hordeum vulgare subsp. vulgare]|uniref:Predicted protein n=1 Tax=Hordeum vulgare subsp. vulgare TaxID=112509 RepID=F2E0N7_HORVV|nr:uclacyanin 1-like [Hordeum vulgare subsp. vulgare]KAI4972679.1 hypothetical protein ZWY2020_003604 [Hordeum vulgare]KAI4972680.1 hypothetical protein ZWY2020_003605 [Hordeum vulgare]BAK00909.1 predicted protein [Hordeum vulgare subsp. vulgare]